MSERISPFDFAKTIHETKEDLIAQDPEAERDYNAFMVNRVMSYFIDTIMQANEMNRLPHVLPRCQYAYLLATVSKKRRYSKWNKPDPERAEKLEIIKRFFEVSERVAISYLPLLTDEQLGEIREKMIGSPKSMDTDKDVVRSKGKKEKAKGKKS